MSDINLYISYSYIAHPYIITYIITPLYYLVPFLFVKTDQRRYILINNAHFLFITSLY